MRGEWSQAKRDIERKTRELEEEILEIIDKRIRWKTDPYRGSTRSHLYKNIATFYY